MIRYDLICDQGHEFDGWFSDSAAYDTQRKRGFVECTHCGSAKVDKQIMAPNIGVKGNRKADATPAKMMTPPVDPRMQMMMQMMREMRAHVEKTAEKRGIYGSATPDDARELLEEGIEVLPLPVLPEDGN
jgi:hypothetical protein